jgi:uncharacterized repeat protein (TIGR01451 family)
MFKSNSQRRRLGSRRARSKRQQSYSRRLSLENLEPRLALSGTWTALAHAAPAGIGTMELLSDGTVIGTQGKNWYKLTPDASGSYTNGTWSTMASMSLERLYDATNMLPDGRVFVLGGEYSGPTGLAQNWTSTGEIYNPVTNTWSSIPNDPETNFGDDPSALLPDGRVLVGSVNNANTYIYDPANSSWSNGPTKLYSDRSDEETWTKLADGSILSYDIFGNAQEAQRMDPATMSWIDSGRVPVALQNSGSEIGPAVLLPDGRVFQIGATSNTAFYTPSATPGGTGSWAAGPVIPGGLTGSDTCAAMMPNGDVLLAAVGSSSKIYEFDPAANSFTDVTSGLSAQRMLALPSGQVLVTNGGSQLYVYTPSGSPQPAWKPTIASVVPKGSNYTLTGTQLNGLSAGASYGDDAEMDTNYPIIEFHSGTGQVYFARTFNWSSTGVATGNAPETTDFSLPASMPYGTYSLTVVASGIASAPVSFTGGIVGSAADLVVTNSGPNSGTEGSNITFTVTVTNAGPTNTTNVVLTDTLDPNLKYASATKSQGSVAQSGHVVTFSLGSLAVGQTATFTVTAEALDAGNLSDSASATSSLVDANPYNNTAAVSVPMADPAIVVSAPLTTIQQTLTNQTVATFTHASGLEPASAFVATINWGDATTSTGTITESGSTYSVIASHTYAVSGTYTIVTSVVEPVVAPPPSAWMPLASQGNGGNARFALLSDGSVLVPRATSNGPAGRLIPDASGSYINGTWTSAAGFTISSRNSASMIVLPDGRVLMFGGLQNNVTPLNDGQIFNPQTNTWTNVANFPAGNTFGNGPMMLLSDGRVLAGAIDGPQTYIYDPATDSWSAGPTKLYGDTSDHESWALLPDGSILSYDVNSNPEEAQRLDPTTMTWTDAGSVPVALEAGISASQNMGPGVLLPDGRVLQLGRSSQTAIYTPPTAGDGTNGVGSWAAGPVIPDGLEAGGDDVGNGSTAALLPNGYVLFEADVPDSGGPTRFFEFDPTAPLASSLTDVTPPIPDFQILSSNSSTRMLLLPTGQLLLGIQNPNGESYWSNQAYIYTPSGAPQAAWQPTVTSVVANGDGSYTLTGTQLNGLSAGASHGTSTQMATNYPLVELTDSAGHVVFARTFNWSSTGVATGATPETTQFSLPPTLIYGTYSLTVVANGIASAPVSFTGGTQGRFADVVVTNSGPTTSTEGSSLTYSFTVINNGPYSAPNVVLADTLDPSLSYQSATKSQGSSTLSGNVVTFSFGSLGVGQSVTATVTVVASDDGNLNNSAAVTSSILDPISSNNLVVVTTAVAEPPIVVSAPKTLSGKNQSNVTVATFTHANGVEPASALVATINWGDNTTSTGTITESGTTYTVKGSHTYASNGSHTVTTTVVESESSGGPRAPAQLTGSPSTTLTTRPASGSSLANNWTNLTATSAARTAALDALLADLASVSTHHASAPVGAALVDQVLGGWDRWTDDTTDWFDAADPLASRLEAALASRS